ncbi:MAG TPA: DUF1223 domain-containing protein [Opitutaceae bacterium]|jgi:hypothetical protein
MLTLADMRTFTALGFLAACTGAWAAPQHFTGGPGRVALIELYTSEGCSSCPPADAWLSALAGKPGLWREFVPVEFHVNYWDDLGWKDRLATPANTARQRAYAREWGSASVYTPCFVRDGLEWHPGYEGHAAKAAAGVLEVWVRDARTCELSYRAPMHGAENGYSYHIALLGSGIVSRVTAGENGGRTLSHSFVVLGLGGGIMDEDAGLFRAVAPIPAASVPASGRTALAAWVCNGGAEEPAQAAGGWLP